MRELQIQGYLRRQRGSSWLYLFGPSLSKKGSIA